MQQTRRVRDNEKEVREAIKVCVSELDGQRKGWRVCGILDEKRACGGGRKKV